MTLIERAEKASEALRDACGGTYTAQFNAAAEAMQVIDDMARALIAAEELSMKADRVANFTIGNMMADDPEVRAKYPHLSEAILELRAALAAFRKAGEAYAD